MWTKDGQRKGVITMRERYGDDYFREIGKIGGTKSRGGGFTGEPERAKAAAKIGGSRSKRGHRFIKETKSKLVYQRVSDGKIVEFEKHDH